MYKKTLKGRAVHDLIKKLLWYKIFADEIKYFQLLKELKCFFQRSDLKTERHQVVILVKTLNFSYCGGCSTWSDVFKGPGPTLRSLPFEKTCKDSCHKRILVTDSLKDGYTIFQIMSFEDIIKLIEHNTIVDVCFINFVTDFKGDYFEHFIPYDDKFYRRADVRDFICPEHYKPSMLLEK